MEQFGTTFSQHSPLWLVISLGINDTKTYLRSSKGEEAEAKLIALRCAEFASKAKDLALGKNNISMDITNFCAPLHSNKDQPHRLSPNPPCIRPLS